MISVCIATYNGEEFLKMQISSILPQLKPTDEVIISDDNSTDGTIAIINSFNDSRIKVFKNKNKGLLSNFENALENSKGEIIFLSDQDDVWMENKVEACMESFRDGFDLVLSDCTIFDSVTSNIIQESFFSANNSQKGVWPNILKNSYIGCCMAFRSKVKNKVLPFPKSIPMHDSWIGISSELFYKVKFDDRKLIKYRKHIGNASFTGSGISKYSISKKISFRYFLIVNLIKRHLFKI